MAFSGTIVESGYLIIRAYREGDDTTFARILHMVEEAQDKKAKTQKPREALKILHPCGDLPPDFGPTQGLVFNGSQYQSEC
jgi:hypothetical protein